MPGRASDQTGRFMHAIAALSAAPDEVVAFGRRLRTVPEHDDPVLDALLTEISETVLRRVLVFCTSDDKTLKLDVMERRVLHVMDCTGDVTAQASEAGRALEPEDAAGVLGILRQFAQSADAVYVRSALHPPGQNGVFDGVSLSDLTAARDVDAAQSTLPADMKQTLEAAQQHAKAITCTSAEAEVWRWGDDAGCAALAATGATQAPSGGIPDSLAMFGQGADGDQAVLLAQWQGLRILILQPVAGLDAQFALWHGALFTPS